MRFAAKILLDIPQNSRIVVGETSNKEKNMKYRLSEEQKLIFPNGVSEIPKGYRRTKYRAGKILRPNKHLFFTHGEWHPVDEEHVWFNCLAVVVEKIPTPKPQKKELSNEDLNNIVKAAIFLDKTNHENGGYVPDFILSLLNIPLELARKIRDIVQINAIVERKKNG